MTYFTLMHDDPKPYPGETMSSSSDQPREVVPGQDRDGMPNFAASAPHPDADPDDGTPEDLMQAASERIRALEGSNEEMREKWMRAEAEMANVRSRAKRDVDDARQYAVQKFAKDVVEAAENLRRGLASLPPVDASDNPVVTKLREGFEGVERSFLGILERNGISGADPTGSPFDANLHQAMAEQPSSEHPPGTVIQAWTSAWTLNGRLLKPAMVVVARAAEPVAVPAGAPESVGFDKTV